MWDGLDLVPRYKVQAAGLTPGQLARRAGVNPQTLRYYERRGLLPPPRRQESGYRAYASESLGMVRFIKRAQEVGFSLSAA
jgi:DNA-binding transcriptional MerR regulator